MHSLIRDALAVIKEWQDLIAGLLGFGGAITAIVYTARSESRKRRDDAKALRQALGVELRDMASNVLRIRRILSESIGEPFAVSVDDLAGVVRFVQPIIYRQTAGRIAEVGKGASAVVYFYSQIERCEEAVTQVRAQSIAGVAPTSISVRRDVLGALDNALRASEVAIRALEPMTTEIAARDQSFLTEIREDLK